jgi:hypothetical protein
MSKRRGALVVFARLVHAHATFNRGHHLARLETVDAHRAPRAHLSALHGRAVRVGGVFEQDQTLLARPLADPVHLAGQPPGMHHLNRPRPGCELALGILEIKRPRSADQYQ